MIKYADVFFKFWQFDNILIRTCVFACRIFRLDHRICPVDTRHEINIDIALIQAGDAESMFHQYVFNAVCLLRWLLQL